MSAKSQRELRIEIINIIYANELLNRPINITTVFEENTDLSPKQFDSLEKLVENYSFYKQLIEKYLHQNWKWERVSPLHRAILLNAINEIMLGLAPKIATNEAIEITKLFFDDATYKMINAIIQNIYKHLITIEVLQRKVNQNEKQ
ncbi:transcription antitermination factor NusB [Mycoplasmopsis iners]|uniref:transcription antitermination factor NusB n=1 Tax=Mycoplasmopsis iners TaxID=76630 RepID=UPI0004959CF4|nr:transcription antitermination factor NusB [Mycoplasmopsis iners]